MDRGTEFYIKSSVDNWVGKSDNVSMADYLTDHKFHVIGGNFKKKIFDAILWLMKKLDVRTINLVNEPKTMVYKRYRLTQDDIKNLIRRHKIDLEYVWRENPRYLVVGQDVFQKLFNDQATHYSSIDMEFRYNVARAQSDWGNVTYGSDVVFWGFKVLIVPWINGCFLLPNL